MKLSTLDAVMQLACRRNELLNLRKEIRTSDSFEIGESIRIHKKWATKVPDLNRDLMSFDESFREGVEELIDHYLTEINIKLKALGVTDDLPVPE